MREKPFLLWISLVGISLIMGVGAVYFFYTRPVGEKIGFTVKEIVVKGRQRISKAQLLEAIQVRHGDSIWKHPLINIKKKVQEIPWVHTAVIQRMLPHTLVLTLVEKIPLAIWQHQGTKKVIDQEGQVIQGISSASFKDLPVITGAHAPKYFRALYEQMQRHWKGSPIKGASFLRSCRWNLYLSNGQIIMLPETSHDYEAAFKRLEEVWPTVRNATTIDLRFLDALIFEPHL